MMGINSHWKFNAMTCLFCVNCSLVYDANITTRDTSQIPSLFSAVYAPACVYCGIQRLLFLFSSDFIALVFFWNRLAPSLFRVMSALRKGNGYPPGFWSIKFRSYWSIVWLFRYGHPNQSLA